MSAFHGADGRAGPQLHLVEPGGEETSREVTERVGEERLRLLASVSHDLRTPLTSIMLRSELLATGIPAGDPATVREYARHIHEASEHMLFLVDQIQSFVRIESGAESVWEREADLVELFRGVERFVRPMAEQKALAFSSRAPAGPLMVLVDGGKVRQVLLNLLSNAVRFTDYGEVEFSLEVRPGGATFRVRDTGRGISADDMERIFVPFWQGREGRRGEVRGSGLGLSIVRHLAGILGAGVTAESEPGVGSCFTLELPLTRLGEPGLPA